MTDRYSELAYRRAAGEGASHIGLLTIVYDTLADDLRNAGQAVLQGDIAARCKYSNHGLSLLGHLESWVQSIDDAALRESLMTFYGYLRSQILCLQAEPTFDAFESLASSVRETRAVWQQKESASRSSAASSALSARQPLEKSETEIEAVSRFSWSA